MIWSTQQEIALQRVGQWLKFGNEPYFTLAGYAGTGKTTLAKHLAAGCNGLVLFAAYTGKAVHVLRKTDIRNVSTIHQLIYRPRAKCDLRLRLLKSQRAVLLQKDPVPKNDLKKLDKDIKAEIANLNRPDFTLNTESLLMFAELLVIDEYSMIDQQMGEDLLSFGCRILLLGDPGQLPPVNGAGFFDDKPDYMLTDIRRQEMDNPIIKMSTDVREGRRLSPGTYGDSRVLRRRDVSDEELAPMMLKTDQLLVGMHKTRKPFNQYFRDLLGMKGEFPSKGDKIICLRNSHDEGLYNGQTWMVKTCTPNKYLTLELEDEDSNSIKCLAHPNHFIGTGDSLSPFNRMDANEFDYGYAMTVHKSQGSQWDKVVIMDEWRRPDHDRWLYTGITRAADTITVLQ